jgi:formylglycine-generating enzyme required for sulfatase activity
MMVGNVSYTRSVYQIALLWLFLYALPAGAFDLEGAVSVKLKHASRVEYRAGLIIGEIPDPVNWSVVLLPSDALYTANLEYIDSLSSGTEGNGQVLDVPTIEVGSGSANLNSLSMVALNQGPPVGVAACIRGIGQDQPVRIATTATSGGLQSLPGLITELSQTRSQLRLDSASRLPMIGDPIYVAASREPYWRVLGVVRSVHNANSIEILTLPEIFRRLPMEAGAWAMQPLGLCDYREDYPLPGFTEELGKLIQKPFQAMLDPEQTDPIEVLGTMRAAWPSIRSYLTRPGIEHYFFHPDLPDESQFLQFWQSIMAVSEKQAQLQSPLAAAGPIVRLRTRLPNMPADRGWALAVSYQQKRKVFGGMVNGPESNTIILLTAFHLVKPGPNGEREIKVYFPLLQGIGLDAMRLPVVDESLDLAVLVLEMPAEFRKKVFTPYQVACPDSIAGPVEVPVNAWGWRRDRLPGSVEYGLREGELRVKGVDVTQGFSGGALLKNGNQFAGILTKDLGTGRDALAVSIDTVLNRFRLGTPGITRIFCPPPTTLEERFGYRFARSYLMRDDGLVTPDTSVLAKLFYPEDVTRIHTAELPTIQNQQREVPDVSGVDPQKIQAYLDSLEWHFLNELANWEYANTRCANLTGQSREPASQEHLEMTAPLGPDGRPTISQEDTLGCDLPLTDPKYPRPMLRSGLNIPLCVFGKTSDGAGLLIDDRLWDASFLKECEGLEFSWYVPPGWIRDTAALAPAAPELVQIPAGYFQMGGCQERINRDASGIRWALGCERDSTVSTFQASTSTYRIQQFPVMVAEYARCVQQGKCHYQAPEPDVGQRRKSPCNWGRAGRARHPMNCITWTSADEYCTAVGGRLPTEVEWEKAARGTDGRWYPWNSADEMNPLVKLLLRDSSMSLREGRTMAVDLAPELKSPYGLEDMTWHIKEWTADLYEPYAPGWTGERLLGNEYLQSRVIRGMDGTTFERQAWPVDTSPESEVGFRCVF